MSTQPSTQQSNDSLQALIPTKNAPALIGYYLGVFGLIPFLGLPLSVAAVVLGILGLKKYKATPTPGAKAHAMIALVLGIVELAVFAIFLTWIIVSAANSSR